MLPERILIFFSRVVVRMRLCTKNTRKRTGSYYFTNSNIFKYVIHYFTQYLLYKLYIYTETEGIEISVKCLLFMLSKDVNIVLLVYFFF